MPLRVLIFIPAYNAESTIVSVLERIPRSLADTYDVSVLIIDDSSTDRTLELARAHGASFWCPVTVQHNKINQGYGGNQKLGYQFAIEHDFNVVAMVHGDGQYAPECLPQLLAPFLNESDRPDAVYGSRMMENGAALRGGMPRYKFLGNIALTWLQNRLLGTRLSEFHSGFRLYLVSSLQRLPFELNSDNFDFDTEIIIQVIFSGGTILELPIPTFYGDEVCHVNGLAYSTGILLDTVKARLMLMGLYNDVRYPVPDRLALRIKSKYPCLPDEKALRHLIWAGSHVLLVQCGSTLPPILKHLDCRTASVTPELLPDAEEAWKHVDFVLLRPGPSWDVDAFSNVLAVCAGKMKNKPHIRLLVSCPNLIFSPGKILCDTIAKDEAGSVPALKAKSLATPLTLPAIDQTLSLTGFVIEHKYALPGRRTPHRCSFARCANLFRSVMTAVFPRHFAGQYLYQARLKQRDPTGKTL